MTTPSRTGVIEIGAHSLEFLQFGPEPEAAPAFVLLHDGLGSAALWAKFSESLAAATGAGVFAYSRAGYGGSSPVPLPRPFGYMHEEALAVLPALLDRIGFREGFLVGSSDGASIATIYAGQIEDPRVRGLVLIAPHFFVEDETVAGAVAAREAYFNGDLRSKLARWHTHVDVAFHGWNDAWLDPGFKPSWNITDALPQITVPMLIIQGENDEYGTLAQIEAAQSGCFAPVMVNLMPGVGHAPFREAPDATLAAITAFARPLLGGAFALN
jgi:pimeloyl-ACP methyl ester carboxylesterase